jgi:hypothetical protein
MQTFSFPDGYTVTIDDRGQVTAKNAAGVSNPPCHASHFGPVTDAKALAYLESKGLKAEDYLFANPAGRPHLLRSKLGVAEAIAEIKVKTEAEAEERDRKHREALQAAIEAGKQASGLTNPVHVYVAEYDGYPYHIEVEGRKLKPDSWSVVKYIDGLNFIEYDQLALLVAEHDAKVKEEQDAIAARDAAAKADFEAKAAEAKATGKPIATCGIGHGPSDVWKALVLLQDRFAQVKATPPNSQWLAVVILPGIAALTRDDIGWLGDFERCMAAAMLTQ